ncbi:MAG: T9SS type A sorting domain-containing protein [Rhodothermaceae bacterium]|nr:T9SS type A sorting domain-containing protein [Rhodothermaceae bacterium]
MSNQFLFSLCVCIGLTGLLASSTANAQVLINEFDVDQTGTDTAEFVELYDGGSGNTSLDGHVIVLFNGSDNASYQAFDLDGSSTNADGYFVLCGDATMVANCDLDVGIPTNLIQNGADAMALYVGDASDFPEDTPVTIENLVDAVVYGTADGDDVELLALLNEGQPQIDESANEASTTDSNQRIPNGAGGARNTDVFVQAEPTPGAANGEVELPLVTDIRINEVSHGEVDFMGSMNWVELYNAGESEVDIAEMILCDFPSYPVITELSVLSGSTTLAAGGYVVLSWANLDDDAEVGLYQANASGRFDDATLIIDYMQYGSAGHTREETAIEAGVWTADEFVALAGTGESLQYFDNGMVGSGNWTSAPATPGEENAEPVVEITDVRINEVSHGEVDFMGSMNWVELYNAGDSEVDISELILCDFPNYPVISTLSVLSGNTLLAAGEFVVLSWTNLDDDAEVGLYQANAPGSFDNADLMIDYMQYASAGHQREGTAVEAGVWTAEEFVDVAMTGESLQYFDNGMVGSGNWSSAPATPGAENAKPVVEPADVVINEFDADQTDTDAAEFIELYDGGTGNTSLDGHVIVLFNGGDDASYEAFDLDGTTTNAGGYFVLCGDATMVANCDLDVGIPTNLIQNGADAIALFVGDASDFPEDTPVTTENLVDAVVYGTSDDDDTDLLILLNEGQSQIDENANLASTTESNQRIPNGAGGVRNTDMFVQAEPTPGAENLVPEVTLVTDIQINEVSHGEVDFMGSMNWVELYNAGDTEVDISALFLCDFPNYLVISSLTVLSGSTTLAAGGYVVLSWTDLDEDAEVGLYQASAQGDFGNADLMIDYMQYASAGHQREGTAVEAGVWTAEEFVALASAGETLQFFNNGMVGAGNWASAPATPGEANAEPIVVVNDIRINEVSHGEIAFQGSRNWVELYNAGDGEVDVSQLFLCDFPSYPRIADLTVLSGSTSLAAGEYLVLDWSNIDEDAEVGLYQANAQGDFGNASLMIDYMQYASAGHQREGTAVEAGVWTAGEFVALSLASETLQYFDNDMVGEGNWDSSPATPGSENELVRTSTEDIDALPTEFKLYGNYPNPFNPTTTISYDLSESGHVTLKVYSILGREIATLVDKEMEVGSHKTAWNGRDSQGEIVPSGTYVYRLTYSNGQSQSNVMTLLK